MNTQTIQERQDGIAYFVKEAIGEFGIASYIKTDIKLNDDSDSEYTAFEVTLTNETNDNKSFSILSINDEGEVSMERGEDFDGIDTEDFLRNLFFDLFITYPES